MKTSFRNFIDLFFWQSGKVSRNDFFAGLSVVMLLLIIVNQAFSFSYSLHHILLFFPLNSDSFPFLVHYLSTLILAFAVYNFLNKRVKTIGVEKSGIFFILILPSLTLILISIYLDLIYFIGMAGISIYLIYLLSKKSEKSEEDCEQVDENIFIAFKYIVSVLIYSIIFVFFIGGYFAELMPQYNILDLNFTFLILLLLALFIKISNNKQESNTALKIILIVYVFCECLKYFLRINDIYLIFSDDLILIVEIATYVVLILNVIKLIPSRELSLVEVLENQLQNHINHYSNKTSESEKDTIMTIMLDVSNKILCLGEDIRSGLVDEVMYLLLQNNQLHTDLIHEWTSPVKLEDDQYKLSQYIKEFVKDELDSNQ